MKRVLSGLFLIPIVIYIVLYVSISSFTIVAFIVALYGLWEYNNVVSSGFRSGGEPVRIGPSQLWAVPGAALPLLTYYSGLVSVIPALIIIFIIYLLISFVILRDSGGLRGVGARFFGVLYISLLLSHFISLRQLPDGNLWLLFAMAIVWAGDTGAYYGGKNFGKKKLSPTISPNKTVEGALCGLFASMVVGLIYAHFAGLDLPIILTLFLALIGGVGGIFGDLTESYIKRRAGVKDSGTLIPGHGGLLDRIDSVLFSVPIVYYFLYFSTLVR